MTPEQAAAFEALPFAPGRGGGPPLGRRGQGPGRDAPEFAHFEPLLGGTGQVTGVRDRALTATELCTLNATARPR